MQVKKEKHVSLGMGALLILGLSAPAQQAAGLEQPIQHAAIYHQDSVVHEALSGYYRFPNRAAHIYFFAQDGHLVAQQVWDGRVYPLRQTAPLRYESNNEGYAIEFIEGANGNIDKAKILNRVVLEKVTYNPTQPVTLTAAQLQPLLGDYQLQKDPSMVLSISVKEGKLALTQHWDNATLVFEAFSPTVFFNAESTFPLTFVVEGGEVNQLICFESDLWERAADD